MNYKIVADSSSNVYKLEGIDYACAPLKITAGEKEYVDVPDTDVHAMAHYLKNTTDKSRTSCPNIYDWQEGFRGANNIFAVTITSGLSGSYASAINAKIMYEEENEDVKIHVIDSLSAGPELRLIIEKLKDLINSKLDFEDIVKQITEYKKHTHLFFCLESLTNLARNGRVKPAIAHLAGIFGIRVIGKASNEGTLEPLSKPRGAKAALASLYQHIKETGFNGGKVRIAHCENESFAQSLRDMILADFPDSDVEIEPCGALCTFYAELGGILVGVEG